MRYLLVFFIFLSLSVSAQKKSKTAPKVDSVSYYIELSNFNIKTNNYKCSLYFAHKAIEYEH